MGKIFIVLILFFFSSCSVFAADWYELHKKMYVDLASCKASGTRIKGWFKELNPGDWEPIDGKKIWYRLVQVEADISNGTAQTLYFIEYDLNGSVITSYDFTKFGDDFSEPVPDSQQDCRFKILEILYNKGYGN